MVAVDDGTTRLDDVKRIACSDTPVVFFSSLKGVDKAKRRGSALLGAVSNAVARGNIREKIASITDDISRTSRMIATL